MVNIPAIKHLLPKAVIQKELVVALFGEVEAADGEHDLAVLVVGVYEIRRHAALGFRVADTLDDAIGVDAVAAGGLIVGRTAEIGLVDGKDEAAEAGDGLELVGSGGGPRGAVVRADVCAALPQPACAAEHEDALHPT